MRRIPREFNTALEAVGARLIYLSPYSPDFSPIEPFWSKVKAVLNSIGARTYQALEDGLQSAYKKVSLEDFTTGLQTVVTVPHPPENRYIEQSKHLK